MATLSTSALPIDQQIGGIGPGQALRLAWTGWVVLLLTPFALFLAVMWRLLASETMLANRAQAEQWFMTSMGFLALVVPLAFFIRGRLWRKYYDGECIEPLRYLAGMMVLWVSLEIGGILALLGCLLSDSLLPNLVPAVVSFMFFVPFWPSGHAMTHTGGKSDDPQRYEEPR